MAKPLDVHWFTVDRDLYTGQVEGVHDDGESVIIRYRYKIGKDLWRGEFFGVRGVNLDPRLLFGPWKDIHESSVWQGKAVLYMHHHARHGRSVLWGTWDVGDRWNELKAPYRWGFDIPLLNL